MIEAAVTLVVNVTDVPSKLVDGPLQRGLIQVLALYVRQPTLIKSQAHDCASVQLNTLQVLNVCVGRVHTFTMPSDLSGDGKSRA